MLKNPLANNHAILICLEKVIWIESKWNTILYATICDLFDAHLWDIKLTIDMKMKVQMVSYALLKEEKVKIGTQASLVSIFDCISLTEWSNNKYKDPILGMVGQFVTARLKLESSIIVNIWSKAVCKYLLQFERPIFKQGLLHKMYISSDKDDHQLVLPSVYKEDMCKWSMTAIAVRVWSGS